MKIRKMWANLAVADLERTDRFYKQLGFKPNGTFKQGNELTSFLVGEDAFVVHFFWNQSRMFKSSLGGNIADLNNGNEVMFTLSADSRDEVEEWAHAVRKAGGTVFSEPQVLHGNENWYGCAFADPDGHKWNVFCM